MKKKCTLIFLIIFLLYTELFSSGMNGKIYSTTNMKSIFDNYENSNVEITYKPEYNSEYWNFIEDKYQKCYYQEIVNADFSESNKKNVCVFKDDDIDRYSEKAVHKAFQFARLDHPELELLNMDYNIHSIGTKKNCIYKILSYSSDDYSEYQRKLNEVNVEIKDLVDEVNNTESIIKKHRLIYDWLTSNVKYCRSGNESKFIIYLYDEYTLGSLKTDSTQNIYGAIVEKKAICDGISDAYKYICNQCGLECIIVNGYVMSDDEKDYHSWNLVKVYDSWYLVDATWGIGKNSTENFLVGDLKNDERKPINFGYTLSSYEDEYNIVTIAGDNGKKVMTKEGIELDLLSEDYRIGIGGEGRLAIYFTASGVKKKYEDPIFKEDFFVQTNAEILTVEYFDDKGSLLKVLPGDDSTIYFISSIDGRKVDTVRVTFKVNNEEYEVRLMKR